MGGRCGAGGAGGEAEWAQGCVGVQHAMLRRLCPALRKLTVHAGHANECQQGSEGGGL